MAVTISGMDQTTSTAALASSSNPSNPARTIAAAEVPGLLAEFEASGQPLAQFARERGIAKWRLYEERRKARRAGSGTPRRRGRAKFAPVSVTEDSRGEPLELVLAAGHRVRIPADFDESALRRLMGVLASC